MAKRRTTKKSAATNETIDAAELRLRLHENLDEDERCARLCQPSAEKEAALAKLLAMARRLDPDGIECVTGHACSLVFMQAAGPILDEHHGAEEQVLNAFRGVE